MKYFLAFASVAFVVLLALNTLAYEVVGPLVAWLFKGAFG